MSGHSKFSNIKHKKQAQDAQRSKIFQKYAHEILNIAKIGGTNPEYNFSLKKIIERARAENMPKDRITKILDRVNGVNEFSNCVSVVYECYYSKSVGIIVDCLTNNKNRTSSYIKSVFRSHGLKLADSHSLSTMFAREIHLHYDASKIPKLDAFLMNLLDCDLIDLDNSNLNDYLIKIAPTNYSKLKSFLDNYSSNYIISINMLDVPCFKINLDKEKFHKLENVIELLNEGEDVVNVVHNAIFSV